MRQALIARAAPLAFCSLTLGARPSPCQASARPP